MRFLLFFLCLPFILCGCSVPEATAPEHVEMALVGGRVMDPESGLDAVRNVGISNGTIVAITDQSIDADETVDVAGLVVAPGFIDLHAHGQDPVSNRLQAADGVTTALEMELGVYPVGDWLASREGKAVIHFGATVGHLGARVKLMHGIDIGHNPTLPAEENKALERKRDYAYKEASPEQIERLIQLLDHGLDEGALGLGLGITYTPAASTTEIFRAFQLAAGRGAPVFVHVRGTGSGPALGGFQEVISNAAASGAALHIVHMNSSANERAPVVLEMIRGARSRGVDLTTETYPYTAGCTWIESAVFDSWEDVSDEKYRLLQWPPTGERLTGETFRKYREQGGWVILHGNRSEKTNEWLLSQPDVMIASDGIPFLYGPTHPRGAGTFSRVLGRYRRDQNSLGLMQALEKMTLQPARRLENFAPVFKKKGRVRVGADADLTVFDPLTVLDRSTYEKADVPAQGMAHVLVAGTFVVRDAKLVKGAYPGQALRGSR